MSFVEPGKFDLAPFWEMVQQIAAGTGTQPVSALAKNSARSSGLPHWASCL